MPIGRPSILGLKVVIPFKYLFQNPQRIATKLNMFQEPVLKLADWAQERPAVVHVAGLQGAAEVRPAHLGLLWRCGCHRAGEHSRFPYSFAPSSRQTVSLAVLAWQHDMQDMPTHAARSRLHSSVLGSSRSFQITNEHGPCSVLLVVDGSLRCLPGMVWLRPREKPLQDISLSLGPQTASFPLSQEAYEGVYTSLMRILSR